MPVAMSTTGFVFSIDVSWVMIQIFEQCNKPPGLLNYFVNR